MNMYANIYVAKITYIVSLRGEEAISHICGDLSVNMEKTQITYIHTYHQELMSGEAAKERVITAYTWVPSKSKSLAS